MRQVQMRNVQAHSAGHERENAESEADDETEQIKV
jgi:hypothetical protein